MSNGTRTIVARGLTPNDYAKPVQLPQFDEPVFLKSVEHMDKGTYATVIVTVKVEPDALVVVHD